MKLETLDIVFMKKIFLAVGLSLACLPALGQQPSHCRISKLASLPIDFTRLRPTLPGKFNGVDLNLLMDSGASTTVIFPAGVQKAGLEETHSDLLSSGVGGTDTTYLARAEEVEIGPSRGTGVRFLEARQAKSPADGLLGADYLFRTDLEVLLRDKQVTFLVADNCDDMPLAYWDREAPWVVSHDYRPKDRRQEIEVRINGRSFRAILDTGAQQSILDLKAAASIGVTPDSAGTQLIGPSSGVGDGSMIVWRAPIDSFEIGTEVIQHTVIEIGDLWGAAREQGHGRVKIEGPELLLGADFMRAHHLLFARSQHRLYFTYLGGPVFVPESQK